MRKQTEHSSELVSHDLLTLPLHVSARDTDEHKNEQILTFISPSLCFILSGESIQQGNEPEQQKKKVTVC